MAKPIDNYMREDRGLDFEELFLAEDTPVSTYDPVISRRDFLKGATVATGSAIVPVQMASYLEKAAKKVADFLVSEAEAGNEFSVYIDNFEVAGDLPPGRYVNVERQIPTKLTTILKGRKVKVITDRREVDKKNTLVITGMFSVIENDPEMRTGYNNLPFDSITLDIQYHGLISDGIPYKRDARKFPDSVLEEVANDIVGYLGNGNDASITPPKEAEVTARESPGGMKIMIDGKERAPLNVTITEEFKKGILENNETIMKVIERNGYKVKIINNQPYFFMKD